MKNKIILFSTIAVLFLTIDVNPAEL